MTPAPTILRRQPRGLTLLEVLIVLSLMAVAIGIAVGNLSGASSMRLRTETNKVAAAVRYAYNRSSALGLYMRMVIDMDAHSYWVESSDQPNFLTKDKRQQGDDPEAEEAEKIAEEQEDGVSQKYKTRARFSTDEVIPKVTFEKGIKFGGVMTSSQDDVFEQGRAYIHFFPNGFVEPSIIYTVYEDEYYTLQVNPLTGKVTRKAGRIDPDSNFGEPEDVEEEGR
ncbi:MAG: Tfp pilus assembly protein FimT/FimU [Bradymonadia bacterium]